MSDVRSWSRATMVATALVAVVCVAAIVVVNAPANWLADYLARRTHGVVLLADARGTIWSGSAVMAVAAPHGADEPAREGAGLALPGRVTWTLELERALAPVLLLTHDGVLSRPVAARVRDGVLMLDAGTLALPASMLRLIGAPLNTLLPEGRCSLQWNGLRFDGDGPPVRRRHAAHRGVRSGDQPGQTARRLPGVVGERRAGRHLAAGDRSRAAAARRRRQPGRSAGAGAGRGEGRARHAGADRRAVESVARYARAPWRRRGGDRNGWQDVASGSRSEVVGDGRRRRG